MSFAGHSGMDININIDDNNVSNFLFNEELGAVIQVYDEEADFIIQSLQKSVGPVISLIGKPRTDQNIILNNITDSLASLIGNLVNSIDPELIIMGGGVVINNLKFRNLLIKKIPKYIFSKDVKKIKIRMSKLKDDTGLLGAAAVFK